MQKIDYAKELNSEQLAVVEHRGGPALVLAGAGTGKTRTIVYRIAHLLESGVPAHEILLLTFTNKAAREMMQRIEMLLGRGPTGLMGGTFHSVCNSLLRQYGFHIGVAPSFTILDSEDSTNLVSEAMGECGIGKHNRKQFPKPSYVQHLISFARNSCRELSEVVAEKSSEFELTGPKLMEVARRYDDKKRAAQLCDFDDLLCLMDVLLDHVPAVREQLSGRFKHIMVDEYQDTNRIQAKLIDKFGSVHRNVVVVGDDAQSIYAFRAADVDNILSFPERFGGAAMFRLESNYRSTTPILQLANASLEQNNKQFKKNLVAVRGKGDLPRFLGLPDRRAEASYVADAILDAIEGDCNLRDCAVLVRAAYHALDLELALQKRGIPYTMRGGMRFFERAHIKDVLAFLKVVQNHQDEIAWQRILKLEDGIGPKNAMIIAQKAATAPAFEALDGLVSSIPGERGKAALTRLISRLKQIRASADISKMIENILALGYHGYMKLAYEDHADRLDDLKALAAFARTYTELTPFLSDTTLAEDYRATRSDTGTVRDELVISTIHQAKGLEWKRVFLIGLAQGQFPHYKSMLSSVEIEEERRLFYVAVTRAKDLLYLTFPYSGMNQGGMTINQPSMFVAELPQDYLNVQWEEEEVIQMRNW